MSARKLLRSAQFSVVAAAAVFAAGLVPATASAAPTPAVSSAHKIHKSHKSHKSHKNYTATYRQLLGTVSGPTYLEASVPSAGNYAIEYDITSGVAFFDTYINGTELGYVGGGTGAYLTRSVPLTAGGQLVQVAGPEGSGTANVYIVSTG